jgi:dUTP pyrophosphatase
VTDLPFRRLRPDARLPGAANPGDAGLDLRAAEPAKVVPGERVMIPTGLAVAIPKGHAGLVLPRSGLASKQGLTLANAPGLIDAGYRGELRVLLLNTDRTKSFELKAGERIAQLLVVAHAAAMPVEIDELGESGRGDAGFGSSGR